MKITPAPSPSGRNSARMFLVHVPKGRDPRGALDAALKHGRDEERDAELRAAMEQLIQNYVHEDGIMDALAELERHLPGGKYGDHGDHEVGDEEGEPEGEGRAKMRAFLREKGASDEDCDELFAKLDDEMPRNAREGGMGGRLSDDRKRAARDKRRHAMDASAGSRFDRMFPGAARIKQAY